jgi:protein-disulfide isomerase/uncharacterized membrane protein
MSHKKLAVVIALLCLAGVGVSVELTRIHLFVHTDPDYHSICAISEGINCETVAASPYAVFAGLPVSVWGIAGYLVMGLFAIWAAGAKRPSPTWPLGILLSLTVVSSVASALLAFISATRIDSLCLFCMISYGINGVLFVVCVIAVKKSGVRIPALFARDAKTLTGRPCLAAGLALAGITAVLLLEALVPSYWKTPGWNDLPKLDSGLDASGHHWIGAVQPEVTIVEFSDYECPHCRAAHKAIRATAAQYPRRVRLVHRHLPLDNSCHPGLRRPFHKRACLFAQAAECAGMEGRFWEMNDAIFSIQEAVKTENVDPVDLAVRLGLNRSTFKQCLEKGATSERIADDIREAMKRKLRGTPSFLVGDRLYLGRIPEPELEHLLGTAGKRSKPSRAVRDEDN